LRTWHIWK